jgi:hypothetical protein
MLPRRSSIAHAAYLDLLASLRDEAVSEIRGTPRLEARGGKSYWYDLHRIGTAVRKRYIGEDSAETAARIARHRDLAAGREARDALRSRLIRILRAEGLSPSDPATGSMLAALAQAGTFRLGGTLVGTQAFRLYENELGIRFAQTETMQTADIDIAQFEHLSLALDDRVDPTLEDTFRKLEFAPLPAMSPRAYWRWRQTRSDIRVEFLTPSFREDEDIRPLPALGVSAQSLHFLNFLIAEPIKAAVLYRSGILVQIPRPEAFAIHKLIVADRRSGPDRLKAQKDRLQAALLIQALAEDRPGDLKDAHDDAMGRGAKWEGHIHASLARMPESAALLAAL